MTNRTISLSDEAYEYFLQVGIREPAILHELRQHTARLSSHRMQISPEQGQLMAMLIKLTNASSIIEVGTYTGYSALAMALALPPDGRLITCDIDAETTEIALQFWQQAKVAHKIDLIIGPALTSLESFIGKAQFDLGFIDADKRNYIAYYELLLNLIRPGGLILVDNVLWNGRLVDPADNENATRAIRQFNQHVAGDNRIELCMVPIGDGLTLARKL